MDAIPGYNNVGFSGGFLPPPPAYNEVQPPEDRGDIKKLPVITEDEAREALMGYVSEHCCYGKGAAEDLTFTELESTDAFYYELDTFTEARSTEWAFTPYLGGPLDGPEFGPAPGPWDIPAQCTKLFKDEKRDLEVPHTASAKPCHQCFATGFIRCWKCHGRGRTRCMTCHGTGNRMDGERCVFCHGDGRRRCITCHAKGCVVCNTCQGHRMLKWFIKLTIKWHKHDDHVIVEKTDLPDELIKKANGEKIFKETYPRVYPLQNFPEQEINVGSADLVAKHQYSMERILMQLHFIIHHSVKSIMSQINLKSLKSTNIHKYMVKNIHILHWINFCCFNCICIVFMSYAKVSKG